MKFSQNPARVQTSKQREGELTKMDTKISGNSPLSLINLTQPNTRADVAPSGDQESSPSLSLGVKGQIGNDLDWLRSLGPRVSVEVKKGDTLEGLLMAQGYNRHEIYDKGILKQVCDENDLKDPNKVPIGTKLSLPTKHWKMPKIKPEPHEFPPLPRFTGKGCEF